jgi:hypothetical protein
VEEFSAAQAHRFRYGGNWPYYDMEEDVVCFPVAETIRPEECRLMLKARELVHWTHHKRRLARAYGASKYRIEAHRPSGAALEFDLDLIAKGAAYSSTVGSRGDTSELTLSSREMLLFLVPSRSAICCCVNPAFLRIAIICRFISKAGPSASYSAFTPGCLSVFLRNCRNVGPAILYLLHAFACRVHVARRNSFALLDDSNQHDDFLSLERAEDGAGNALAALGADFKKPLGESGGMGYRDWGRIPQSVQQRRKATRQRGAAHFRKSNIDHATSGGGDLRHRVGETDGPMSS